MTEEHYDNLKESLANVIKDVNEMNEAGELDLCGQKVELEFFLGGDYKVRKNVK